MIWCPTVSTGAFVARRNGKVFITGNSGFPKSLDVSKAIDKAAGAERECTRAGVVKRDGYGDDWDTGSSSSRPRFDHPATDAARQWQGWGTALKPALEPITVARKPLIGTVAANVLAHGTGALNVDGCRVGASGEDLSRVSNTSLGSAGGGIYGKAGAFVSEGSPLGRWPANLIHSGEDDAIAGLGEAARYFYCAKASKKDRDEGLDGFVARQVFGDEGGTYQGLSDSKEPSKNFHPTVKPTDLMRYLCRLVTPPGGVVLDPFMGSGSTGKAAALEGFQFIGIERESEYLEIARARINAVQHNFL